MLLSELIDILCDCMELYGDLPILQEDSSIDSVVECGSVKVVEMEDEAFIMLSDKEYKNVQVEKYLN